MSVHADIRCEALVSEPVLSIRGLKKRFAATLALDDVDLDLRKGEVHALLGENGAGKSTLIKILAGVYTPDGGEIRLDGAPVQPVPGALPIAFIHQDLGLVDTISVAENIALVAGYGRKRGLIDWKRTRQAGFKALAQLGSDVDPDAKVGTLTAADKAIVAIARSLALDASILILDEPTAALPEKDVSRLLETVLHLRAQGVAVLYVTHRLDEVFRIADKITVLRNGRRVSQCPVGDVDAQALVEAIVGRPLEQFFVSPVAEKGGVVLELDGLEVGAVGPVSFSVRAGEVLGLVGLRGAGQTEIGRAIFGDLEADAGRMRLDGRDVRPASPNDAMSCGIGFVSSKRREESLAGGLTVRENLYPNFELLGRGMFSSIGLARERSEARNVIRQYAVRPNDPERVIATLSGGNQQKIIVARWLTAGRRVIILEEPTLGVDVGAKAEIYGLFQKALDAGTAIVLISADMEEVAGISHRALVFNRGRIVHEVPRDQLSVSRLVALSSHQAVSS